MALCINHFSTSFWEVTLMPAICYPSTRAPGLLMPLQKQLLDYHSTINLAGCSKLLHSYRFISIKHRMLVTPCVPHCLTNCGLKTLFFVSNNRFLLMTLFSYDNRSSTELPAYIEEIGANYLIKINWHAGWDSNPR